MLHCLPSVPTNNLHFDIKKAETVTPLLLNYAYNNLPFGSGISRPISLAVSSHSEIIFYAFSNASAGVTPSAIHPGSSGTSTNQQPSSSDQKIILSYFAITIPPFYTLKSDF